MHHTHLVNSSCLGFPIIALQPSVHVCPTQPMQVRAFDRPNFASPNNLKADQVETTSGNNYVQQPLHEHHPHLEFMLQPHSTLSS
jgi:hypothetical protein